MHLLKHYVCGPQGQNNTNEIDECNGGNELKKINQ